MLNFNYFRELPDFPTTCVNAPFKHFVPTRSVVFLLFTRHKQMLRMHPHRALRHYVVFLLLTSFIGPSTVFGSSSKLANVEQWRCVTILRNHTGGEEQKNSADVDAGFCLEILARCKAHVVFSIHLIQM